MEILNISIKNQDGKRLNLERALFIKDKGIERDKNARGGQRQISLLPSEIRQMIENDEIVGLCIKRYKENITYDGKKLLKGQKYKIKDAEIIISKENKRCFPECVNIIENLYCPLVENAVFAKIIKTGFVTLADDIGIL